MQKRFVINGDDLNALSTLVSHSWDATHYQEANGNSETVKRIAEARAVLRDVLIKSGAWLR